MVLFGFVGCIVIDWSANDLGAWYVSGVAGLLFAALLTTRLSILGAGLAAAVAWGASLGWQAIRHLPIHGAANTVGEVVGLGAHQGSIVLTLTALIGFLLGITGAWVGVSFRAMIRSGR